MQFEAIVNLDDGLYLETKDIKSFSIKQIMVDDCGNMAYAIVCYPGPGAGYVVARYNDEENAKRAFKGLLDSIDGPAKYFYIKSKFVQPEKNEPETIGVLTLEEPNVE